MLLSATDSRSTERLQAWLIGADGVFLKFDAAGNEKTVAALKATKKTDHLRATVTGQKDGDSIKVSAIAIE